MKEAIVIVYFSDGQFDVEAYEVKNRVPLQKLDQYTTFALCSQEELDAHLEPIRECYHVVETEYLNLDKGERPTSLKSIKPVPTHTSQFFLYKDNKDELLTLLERHILATYFFNIKFDMYCEDHIMSIGLENKKNSWESIDKISEIFPEEVDGQLVDFTKIIIQEVFGKNATYGYDNRTDTITISTPLSLT